MGQGGFITLVNGTNYDWNNTYSHQYQMKTWSFPATIAAGTSVQVYVEFDQHIFDDQSDDAGEATYTLNGTGYSFQIQARATNGFQLQVQLIGMETAGNALGSTINLGWHWNGSVNFILAGEAGNFTSSNVPTSWLQNNLSLVGNSTLREICIPGSHDAGMSTFNGGTEFGNSCNTQTQTFGILGQLQAGARYFDIRPVITTGQYYTGHYSLINDAPIIGNTWQGANGQSIASIINDINQFTAAYEELVILYLSHDLNTDVGNSSYRPFNQEEWNNLFAQLKGLHNLYVAQNPTTVDLTQLTLHDYIGGNSAAVVVVADLPSGVNLGDYANQGFYQANNFPVYNKYSNTNDLNTMMSDQIQKMKQNQGTYFLLSWTLTQSTDQVVACCYPGGSAQSILYLADMANPTLYTTILSQCTNQCFPNILYADSISYPDVNPALASMAALAMAINWKVAK